MDKTVPHISDDRAGESFDLEAIEAFIQLVARAIARAHASSRHANSSDCLQDTGTSTTKPAKSLNANGRTSRLQRDAW